MSTGERIDFALSAGGLSEEALVVLRLDGEEQLSAPYAFDLELESADGAPLDPEAFVGAEARLALRRPMGAERVISGECSRLELIGLEPEVPRYRLRLVPRLHRLGLVARSRIFQGQTIPEIVQAILDEHGVKQRSVLSRSYPAREYVAQRRESDLAFVQRLLEREGIWYRFEQSEGEHTLVLCDAPSGFVPGPQLPVREEGQGDNAEHAFALAQASALVSDAATRRDFDFELPMLDLTARRGAGTLEVYEYPGGHLDAADGARQAQVRLEQLGYAGKTWAARSNSIEVAAGGKVLLGEELAVAIVRLRHHGVQQRATGLGASGTSYENTFTGLDPSRPYRPPARSRTPRVAGIETATVVGPPGEEIHVDRHGRIKVQFHWDREGKRDERSSCWIRAAQGWGGPGFGASFVPRIGQEVVVRYLEGDPDRPLVTGAVYNGANPVPLALPADRSRATMRTDSSQGGYGSNELLFEDARGAEQVYVHAQKDANAVTLQDVSVEVRNDATVSVARDRSQRVEGQQALRVAGNERDVIRGSQASTVGGDRAVTVSGNHAEAIGGDQSVTVGGRRSLEVQGASTELIGGAAVLGVGAGYSITVGAGVNHAVGGVKSVEVGADRVEVVGARRDERVGGNRTRSVGEDAALQIDGDASESNRSDRRCEVAGAMGLQARSSATRVARVFQLQADRFTLIVGGKKVLELTPASATLSGASVAVQGSAIALAGAGISKIGPAGPQGGQAAVRELQAIRAEPGLAQVRLVDQDGNPVVQEPFVIELADGSTRAGVTDERGLGCIPLPEPKPFKVQFPRLSNSAWRKK